MKNKAHVSVLAARKPKAQRPCTECGKTHKHNNAFCSAGCCKSWRTENPQRGQANHYRGEFGVACKIVNGVEEVLS